MKKLLLLLVISAIALFPQDVPFSKGVNLTEWLQATSVGQIQFNKYSKQDIDNIKSLGCEVIRLPIRLHSYTSGEPDYVMDPLFLEVLDNVVQWAEEADIHLIIDNHTFDVENSTSPNIGDVLIPVWKQLAERYKDSYSKLYYEILNEPHGIDDSTWNLIQGEAVNAIRQIDTTHYIIVGPAGWNSYNNLQYMPEYEDDKLIYTFHFYDPFIFTHQGAGWTDPSMISLGGVPFPYSSSDMPQCPDDLAGTWIESTLNDYRYTGTVSELINNLNIAVSFKTERNVPLFCGEFGVYRIASPQDDRVYWYNIMRTLLNMHDIAWTIWDYQNGFGLFEKNTNELFNYDLNIPLLEALEFNTPPQYEFVIRPDSTDIPVYDDFFASGLQVSMNSTAIADFYSTDNPHNGNRCIYISGGVQYDALRIDFTPDRDFSTLKADNYILDMMIKGDTPSSTIDIRFLDTKTDDPNDHPWRMGITVNSSIVQWDGEWHHLQIPLSALSEKGSWDDGWYPAQGDFDWSAISELQIVAEHHPFDGHKFWFDDIKIVDTSSVSRVEENSLLATEFELLQNYPNPFNPATKIEYNLPEAGFVTLKVFDILGQDVATLLNEYKTAGNYKVKFNAVNLPGGIYFYSLQSGNHQTVKKMVLLK